MSHGSKFEAHVDDAIEELKTLGYKVVKQEVFSHYRGKSGEVWPQRGFAINVFPYNDYKEENE